MHSYLKVSVEAAKKAGALLMEGFGTEFAVGAKEGRRNLVTEYDTKSEELILGMIREAFPEHGILSEECGTVEGEGTQWIVDPLDGTVNFAYNIPAFSISIAAVENGEVVTGVIYNPVLDEMFTAEKGKGATFNGKECRVSKCDLLNDSLLATGLPYHTNENPRYCIDHLTAIAQKGIPLRRIGSAALDLAYTACGRFDGFWEASLQPWDYAAGLLIVEEAGGKVSDFYGAPLKSFSETSVVASNGIIDTQMTTILSKRYDDELD